MGISIKLIKYKPEFKDAWNELITLTDPGSLIHKRSFLEYHSDRYEDFSVCVMSEHELCAAIPGTRNGDLWTSHAGLTYGGIISNVKNPADYIEIIGRLKYLLIDAKIKRMQFILPSVSFSPSTLPIQIYALHQNGFTIEEVHLNQVIHTDTSLSIKKKSNARSAERKGLVVVEGIEHLPAVFEIIQHNLKSKYSRDPVHSLRELELLKTEFLNELKIYAVVKGDSVIAGAITLKSNRIENIQYLGATVEGKRLRAQDYLISELHKKGQVSKMNVSFGKSTAGDGAKLNSPLYDFKDEFNSLPENIFVLSCNLEEV
jgi:hypothetical protein